MARASKLESSPPARLQVDYWSLPDFVPYARNSRTHSDEQIAQIAASIKEFGFVNPILASSDRVIIAGHGRLLAARKLGMTEIPVIVIDGLSENQRRALVLADNKLAVNAGWEEEMLRLGIEALRTAEYDVSLIGFDDEELQQLLAEQDATAGLCDEDEVPEIGDATISRAGDLWVLEEHRPLCGDATLRADTDKLIAGNAVDLVFTDPPYNVDYEGYTQERLKIKGDKMTAEQFQEFLLTTFSSYRRILKPGASIYVCRSSSWQREFQNAMEAAGFEARCQIIWAKNTFA